MAFTRAQSIVELRNRHQRFDQNAAKVLADERATHPDIDDIIPVVLSPITGVTLRRSGPPIVSCKECVNALRLISIRHFPSTPTEVCVACEVKQDDYGYIIGVVHSYTETASLLPLITAGKVEIDNATDQIRVLS